MFTRRYCVFISIPKWWNFICFYIIRFSIYCWQRKIINQWGYDAGGKLNPELTKVSWVLTRLLSAANDSAQRRKQLCTREEYSTSRTSIDNKNQSYLNNKLLVFRFSFFLLVKVMLVETFSIFEYVLFGVTYMQKIELISNTYCILTNWCLPYHPTYQRIKNQALPTYLK